MPKNKLLKVYSPIAKDFKNKLGRPVTLSTKSSFDLFEFALDDEEYDIAFIQPYDYPDAYDNHNYLPLAKRSTPLQTILVVKKDSPYNTLQDLKGEIIAYPAKTAAVTKTMSKALIKLGYKGNNIFQHEYKKNHFACLQSVLIEESAACGTAFRALKYFESVKIKDKFRIIYKAKEIPHALFVVHKRVPEIHRNILKKTIINWPNTKEGKSILSKGEIIPMTEALNHEYDVLR